MIRFRASPPTTVVTAAERTAAGLAHWPDGTMGIVRHGGAALALAPNGRHTARHDLTRGGLVAGLVAAEEEFLEPRHHADHASGGPMWLHPPSGTAIVCYHAERFTDGDPTAYWSWLGFASGTLRDGPFRDLGAVVTSDLPEDASPGRRLLEMGPGAMVEHQDHLLVYFLDRASLHVRLNLGVARAPVSEVVAAARAGRAPELRKYFAGRWNEPGVGGRATDLLADPHHPVLWLDVARLASIDRLVLVHSTPIDRKQGRTKWALLVRTSSDGISWDEGQLLHEGDYGTELLYVTIDGGGRPDRSIDDEFDLYVVASTTGYRWDDARLDRLRVTCR